jgi:predicted transposase/invertase (TIGR01784 family)
MAADQRQAFVAQDREIMDIYERRQKAQWDYASAMSGAERRGIERGKNERNTEVARNALAKGIPAEVICEITGLDLETVTALQHPFFP